MRRKTGIWRVCSLLREDKRLPTWGHKRVPLSRSWSPSQPEGHMACEIHRRLESALGQNLFKRLELSPSSPQKLEASLSPGSLSPYSHLDPSCYSCCFSSPSHCPLHSDTQKSCISTGAVDFPGT